MIRERALKVVLVLVGLLFSASAYLLVRPPFKDETFQMMLSLYVKLGVSSCSRHAIRRRIVA